MDLRLTQKRNCWVPTWRGWVLLLVVTGGLAFLGFKAVFPFLAVQDPVRSEILVVEGWVNDSVLEKTVEEFRRGSYQVVVSTGGPLTVGDLLSEYGTYAEVGARTLQKMGLTNGLAIAVPAPRAKLDRTYTSAVALKHWLQAHYPHATSINLVSQGAHARRTRLLFQKALHPMGVGILAFDEVMFDAHDWWRSSEGFRSVTGELIAYVYARFFFRPNYGTTSR